METVSSASTELEASASRLTATAERSQHLTTMVAAASEGASTNVRSMASATEEMGLVPTPQGMSSVRRHHRHALVASADGW